MLQELADCRTGKIVNYRLFKFGWICPCWKKGFILDPMSPLNPEHHELGAVSPMTTPPATPVSVLDEQCQQNSVRKRTVSNSRWTLREKLERASSDKDKEDRCLTPEFEDEVRITVHSFKWIEFPEFFFWINTTDAQSVFWLNHHIQEPGP